MESVNFQDSAYWTKQAGFLRQDLSSNPELRKDLLVSMLTPKISSILKEGANTIAEIRSLNDRINQYTNDFARLLIKVKGDKARNAELSFRVKIEAQESLVKEKKVRLEKIFNEFIRFKSIFEKVRKRNLSFDEYIETVLLLRKEANATERGIVDRRIRNLIGEARVIYHAELINKLIKEKIITPENLERHIKKLELEVADSKTIMEYRFA